MVSTFSEVSNAGGVINSVIVTDFGYVMRREEILSHYGIEYLCVTDVEVSEVVWC